MTSYADLKLGFDIAGEAVSLPTTLPNGHIYVAGQSGRGKSRFLQHLTQQLITRWPGSGAGLLLLDAHGSLYDAVVNWMAINGYDSIPVVPFDLRSDAICAFNILRPRPGRDPAPLLHAAVRAVIHGWKEIDVSRTPRLSKWLMTIFSTLYESRLTVFEALDLIRNPIIRAAMARQVEDVMAKSVWMTASTMKENAFAEELESTMNRLGRFLSTQVLRLAFSQSDVSLDMLSAMQKGEIVLCSLATEGSRVAEEDAAVVGSLLVSDVHSAACDRGKRDTHRPFTVIVDEFQEFVSPTIAHSLAILRGMGVSFIMAHQSPQQLLDMGPMGRQTLNAIITNTATQVIFQTAHPDDVEIITPWVFRDEVDCEQVKFQPYSTKVLDYALEYHPSMSHSTTKGSSRQSTWATTESQSDTNSISSTRTNSKGISKGRQDGRSVGHGASLSQGMNYGSAESIAESAATGTTTSATSGQARQRSQSQGESRHIDGPYDAMAKIVGPEPTTTFDKSFVDEDEEHRTLRRSIGRNANTTDGITWSESKGIAATKSKSHAVAAQASRSYSHQEAAQTNEANSVNLSEGESLEKSDGISMSSGSTTGRAETVGGGHTASEAEAHGIAWAPLLRPILGMEALPPIFRSVEEQLFIQSKRLTSLANRHAIVKLAGLPPVEIITPTVDDQKLSAKGVRAWLRMRLKRIPYILPLVVAVQRLEERRKIFETKYLKGVGSDEPSHLSRRLKE